jgi:hypothetical protein
MLESVDVTNKLPELKLPLIRLRIENTGFPVIKSKRLIDHFINRIANISDFMNFYKRSGIAGHMGGGGTNVGGTTNPKEAGEPEESGLFVG